MNPLDGSGNEIQNDSLVNHPMFHTIFTPQIEPGTGNSSFFRRFQMNQHLQDLEIHLQELMSQRQRVPRLLTNTFTQASSMNWMDTLMNENQRLSFISQPMMITPGFSGWTPSPNPYQDIGDLLNNLFNLTTRNPGEMDVLRRSFYEMGGIRRIPKQSAIDGLHRITASDTLENKDEECAICQDVLFPENTETSQTDGVILQMDCSHSFHQDCLLEWFKEHHTCPICRHELEYDEYSTMTGRLLNSTDSSSVIEENTIPLEPPSTPPPEPQTSNNPMNMFMGMFEGENPFFGMLGTRRNEFTEFTEQLQEAFRDFENDNSNSNNENENENESQPNPSVMTFTFTIPEVPREFFNTEELSEEILLEQAILESMRSLHTPHSNTQNENQTSQEEETVTEDTVILEEDESKEEEEEID
jgi:hypothetical protein